MRELGKTTKRNDSRGVESSGGGSKRVKKTVSPHKRDAKSGKYIKLKSGRVTRVDNSDVKVPGQVKLL